MNNGESSRLQRYHATMLSEFTDECRPGTPRTVLLAASRVALRRVGGASAASITTTSPDGLATATYTDVRARSADETQYDAGHGPVWETLANGAPCCLSDTHRPARWPGLEITFAEQGVFSALSVSLGQATMDNTRVVAASLNLYASSSGAFSATSVLLASMLAAHAGPCWALACATDRAGNLDAALATQADTGPAIGLLMARRAISHDDALELLRVTSQQSNRKVRDLAIHILEAGDLPDTSLQGVRIPRSRRARKQGHISG